MQRVYGARDSTEAAFVKNLLEAEEIESVVQGGPLESALGDIPVSPSSLPSVWVNEADVPRATQIIDEMKLGGPATTHPTPSWTCHKCGEVVEGQFTQCWNCGTERPAAGDD